MTVLRRGGWHRIREGVDGKGGGIELVKDRHGKADSAYKFNGGWIASKGCGKPLREKTLSAWVKLHNVNQSGAGVVTIRMPGNDAPHDTIDYNHMVSRERGKGWGIGSGSWRGGVTRWSSWSDVKETQSKWIHMVATYKTKDFRLYRNGLLIHSEVNRDVYEFPGNAEFMVGRSYNPSNPDSKFYINTDIDDVRIYNRALSAKEVKSLYDLEKSKGK